MSGRSGDDDCICIFTELGSFDLERFKVIPKAKEKVTLREALDIVSSALVSKEYGEASCSTAVLLVRLGSTDALCPSALGVRARLT